MSLALYFSRVRSNEVLGRRRPEHKTTVFNIYLTTRKSWVREEPRLNEDKRSVALKMRVRGQCFEPIPEEVDTPMWHSLPLEGDLTISFQNLFNIAAVPVDIN